MVPEELVNFFLTKTQMQKLRILNELLLNNISSSFLKQAFNLSNRQLKNIIDDLNMDMEGISSIKESEGIVNFKEEIDHSKYIELVNSCRISYVSSSSLFQVMLFALEKRSFSILQAASDLSYSESYVYKLINKLKKFFLKLNADFKIKKKNETILQLEGCESAIRMFHYLCVSVATRGTGWSFTTIGEEYIADIRLYLNSVRYNKLSPNGKNKVNFILAVTKLALKNGKKIIPLDKDVIALGEIINKENTLLLNYLKGEKFGKTNELHNELVHLCFFLNHFVDELRRKVEKVTVGEEIYHFKKNKIVKSATHILDNLREKFSLTNETYNLLLYHVSNRIVFIHYLNFYKFMPLYKVPPLITGKAIYIEKKVKEGLHAYKNESSFSKLTYSISQLLLGYMSLLHPIKNKVYIEFFHRPEYKSIIENAIEHSYNSEVLQVTENYSESDIIISDTGGHDNKHYFYFDDVFSQNSWYALGSFLNKMVSEQISESNFINPLRN